MARMRSILAAGSVTIAALGAPTSAAAVDTGCDGLQSALDNPANSVVTLVDDEVCHGQFNLPSRKIVFAGGAGTAALSGDLGGGDRTQILSGSNVAGTTIRNLTFVDGSTKGSGGAIEITGGDPVTIENDVFLDDSAGEPGGAVAVLLDHSPDSARAAGPDPVVLSGNTFGSGSVADANGSGVSGGGAFIDADGAPVELTGNTFSGNSAAFSGGGAYVQSCAADADVTITGNTFAGNHVTGVGTFAPERRQAILFTPGGAGLVLSSFCDSGGPTRAGGDFAFTQERNRFDANVVESNGSGAGELVAGTDLRSTDDRFTRNVIQTTDSSGEIEGGGLAVTGSGQTFEGRNLVAAANRITKAGEGGGVYLGGSSSGSLVLLDSTVTANRAATGAGVDGGCLDALTLRNGIVFGNDGTGDDIGGFGGCSDRATAGGARDVRFSIACAGTAAHPGEENLCADPLLAAPATGNVHETAGSPSRDSGSNALVPADLTKDYEGDARTLGGTVDRGADESGGSAPTPTPTPEPTATPAPAPPPSGGVLGVTVVPPKLKLANVVHFPSTHRCVSRRKFRIRLRTPHGTKLTLVSVHVNGKSVKTLRGKRITSVVNLKGLPKGRFRVKITLHTADGRKISGTRRYHTCTKKIRTHHRLRV